jgi:hypothetical protein
MNYTVTWLASAEQELAALWVDAVNRGAITRAAHQIDELLGKNPEQAGESRFESFRILLAKPLGVTFEVSKPDRLVRVHHVWHYRTRS